jgi:hypothetical protein
MYMYIYVLEQIMIPQTVEVQFLGPEVTFWHSSAQSLHSSAPVYQTMPWEAVGTAAVALDEGRAAFLQGKLLRQLFKELAKRNGKNYIALDKLNVHGEAETATAWGGCACARNRACTQKLLLELIPVFRDGVHDEDGEDTVVTGFEFRLKSAGSCVGGGSLVLTKGKALPKAVLDGARGFTHLTPSASVAQMVEQGASSSIPPATVFRNTKYAARRVAMGTASGSERTGEWVDYLDRRIAANRPVRELQVNEYVYRKAVWPEPASRGHLTLAQFGSFAPGAEPKVEGACIMVSKAMIRMVEMWIALGGPCEMKKLLACFDLTFKLNAPGYGLGGFCLPFKGEDLIAWRTRMLFASLFWASKDSEWCWILLLLTTCTFYADEVGVDLWSLVEAAFWDDTAGGRKAHRFMWGSKKFWRDLRHQQAALEKIPAALGGKEWGKYASGNVQFMSSLTSPVFSWYANSYLAELNAEGRHLLSRHIAENVFIKTSNGWDAEWRTAVDTGLPPGYTADCVSQSMESSWDAIKDAVPPGMAHRSMSIATEKVEAAMTSIFFNRNWIKADASGWEMSADTSWMNTRPAHPLPNTLYGSTRPDVSERLIFDSNVQRKVPPVQSYVNSGPLNFQTTVVKARVAGIAIEQIYTVPMYAADLPIDHETHEHFHKLWLQDKEVDLVPLLRTLGIYKRDERYPGGERPSLARFRTLIGDLCAVLVVRRSHCAKCFGLSFICLCRIFWPKRGECSHELYIRWLHGDAAIDMSSLHDLTLGEGQQTPEQLNASLRSAIHSGRPATIPPGSAWTTMKLIKQKAQERAEERQKRTNSTSEAVIQLFMSPAKADRRAGGAATREHILAKLLTELKAEAFHKHAGALSKVAQVAVTLQEAKASGIFDAVMHFCNAADVCLPVRTQAYSLALHWSREGAGQPAAAADAAQQPAIKKTRH